MTTEEMDAICKIAGVSPEDLKYLQSTGLPVDELDVPKELQKEIIKGINDGWIDGFRFAGGTIITFLGAVQMRDKILKFTNPLFPQFGKLSSIDE